jgi:CRISPR-associated RAMP protein (TIGR02581 family)
MLKKLVNEALFTLNITTTGPLLIKSGQATVSGPDMTPVLTWRGGKREVFIPGSSLKGVFRSHIEKIVCSLKPQVVCYPFTVREGREADAQQRQQDYRPSCGDAFNKLSNERKKDKSAIPLEDDTDFVYANSCPTCRLFGSTWFIGRVAIGDAYLTTQEFREQRDGVGIDRLTGGSSHSAKFELEVVSSGVSFQTRVHLRNFEIWQLGMLFAVLQDMEDGLIRLGSGRSRGLGSVEASLGVDGIAINTMRGSAEPDNEVWGLGRWLNNESYGTQKTDFLTLPEPVAHTDSGIRRTRAFTTDIGLSSLRKDAIEQFIQRMLIWEQPAPELTRSGNRR